MQRRFSYDGRILKVECAYHAISRYGRAIQKLQGNTTRFSDFTGIKALKLLKRKMMKLITETQNVIKESFYPKPQACEAYGTEFSTATKKYGSANEEIVRKLDKYSMS
ncbi:hypothetical protein NPIL_284581 [Nephila pilipes]|uniref:Uncharacterized protein n=1 Tax=Nephila pilipes TaxID=299642 RepID=A0A8X6MX07_NEPPI|nr:hypothetical protein NPIL_284581 [Nephila pilipes]